MHMSSKNDGESDYILNMDFANRLILIMCFISQETYAPFPPDSS